MPLIHLGPFSAVQSLRLGAPFPVRARSHRRLRPKADFQLQELLRELPESSEAGIALFSGGLDRCQAELSSLESPGRRVSSSSYFL